MKTHFQFTATKGRDILTVKNDSMGGIKALHADYFKFGWNVSEIFNDITGRVVSCARNH